MRRSFSAVITVSISGNFSSIEMPLVGSSSRRTRGEPVTGHGDVEKACARLRQGRGARVAVIGDAEQFRAPLDSRSGSRAVQGVTACCSKPPEVSAIAVCRAHILQHAERSENLRYLEKRAMPSRVISRDGRPVISCSANTIVRWSGGDGR